jgi:hypothetical protein
MGNLIQEALSNIKQSGVIALDLKVGYSISVGNESSAMINLNTENDPTGMG